MPSRSRILFAIAVAMIAAVIGASALYLQGAREPGSGVALVGGPFSLVNQDGKRVTEKDFAGKYLLVFFGYTSCPDVCPGGLQIMSEALDRLGSAGEAIQPIFITIDPARDTPAVLKDYAANFHPRLVALTGSDADIAAAAKAYRVYYGKPKSEEGKADYLMDHTAIFYFMGPRGEFLTHIAYGASLDDFTARFAAAIGAP